MSAPQLRPAPQPRLGFCCKFIPEDGDAEALRRMNAVTVTMTYLARLGPAAAFDKLSATVAHNIDSLRNQIAHVAGRPPLERLLRVVSSLLPGYTHPSCQGFYRDADLRALIERGLAAAGDAARTGGVRLRMHPSQVC